MHACMTMHPVFGEAFAHRGDDVNLPAEGLPEHGQFPVRPDTLDLMPQTHQIMPAQLHTNKWIACALADALFIHVIHNSHPDICALWLVPFVC